MKKFCPKCKIYKDEKIDTTDGVKINLKDSWIHLWKSNTEPIIRIYTEAPSQKAADSLASYVKNLLTQS